MDNLPFEPADCGDMTPGSFIKIRLVQRDSADQVAILREIRRLFADAAKTNAALSVEFDEVAQFAVDEQTEAAAIEEARKALDHADALASQSAGAAAERGDVLDHADVQPLGPQAPTTAVTPGLRTQSRIVRWFKTYAPKGWKVLCEAAQIAGNISRLFGG